MKLSIILKRSKISLTFLKAILSTYWCPGSYELKRRLKNIESSEPKLITDTKSLFFIKLGLKSIQQVKPVPVFGLENQILVQNVEKHCRHFCPTCPPPLCQTDKHGKSAPNHPGKPLHPPPSKRAMPIWKQHISKRGFPQPSNPRTRGCLDVNIRTPQFLLRQTDDRFST